MYQRTELFSTLQEEEISPTLSACTLADKEEYTEQEADRFQEALEMIRQGKSYKQVSAHFRRQDKSKQTEPETDLQLQERLNISDLSALASERCGTRILFKESVQILESCGLVDKEQYEAPECDRFLEACDLLKKQSKSYEEIAVHFGVIKREDTAKADLQEILNLVGDSAIATEEGLLQVLKEVTAKRGNAISQMYDRMLLTQVAQKMRERQQQTQLFTQFGEQLEAYVEGKSSIPSRGIPPSFSSAPILRSLPESLDNS